MDLVIHGFKCSGKVETDDRGERGCFGGVVCIHACIHTCKHKHLCIHTHANELLYLHTNSLFSVRFFIYIHFLIKKYVNPPLVCLLPTC